MKCKICGCKQGASHKMSCPVSKYRQAPQWVPDSAWLWNSDTGDYSVGSSWSDSDSPDSSSGCE